MQINSEAHKKKKKKSEVTEKNKHASIRKMEKFVKRTLQSRAGGARGRGRSGRRDRPLAPGLFRFGGLEGGNWPSPPLP